MKTSLKTKNHINENFKAAIKFDACFFRMMILKRRKKIVNIKKEKKNQLH